MPYRYLFCCTALFQKTHTCARLHRKVCFFISAITKSGILDADSTGIPYGKAVKGALLCVVGFAVSMLLTIISAERTTLSHISLVCAIFGSYFCFYSLLLLMHKSGKNKERMRRICVLCAILPCFSSVTEEADASAVSALAVILIGCILFGIAIYKARINHKY